MKKRCVRWGGLVGLQVIGAAMYTSATTAIVKTSFLTYDEDLAWTCEHKSWNGSFSVEIQDAPEGTDELIVDEPTYEWKGPNGDDVSFVPSGETATLSFKKSSAFGKNYNMSVTVSWELTDNSIEPPAVSAVTAEDDIALDALQFDFSAVSDPWDGEGTSIPGDGDLTDNRTATVVVASKGCSNNALINTIAFTSEQASPGTPVNKAGLGISFTQEIGDILTWKTTRTYWYGITPNKCCADYSHDYKFEMTVNGCCKTSHVYKVGMPKQNPYLNTSPYPPLSQTTFNEPKNVAEGEWMCEIVLGGFIKIGKIEGLPTTDQYADEIKKEEEYHQKQWMGDVVSEEGGADDCFSLKGIRYYCQQIAPNILTSPFIYARDPTMAFAEAKTITAQIVSEEIKKSKEIWELDKGFCEVKAKAHAGYNAAWMYHCTHEKKLGPSSQQNNHTHPAYR